MNERSAYEGKMTDYRRWVISKMKKRTNDVHFEREREENWSYRTISSIDVLRSLNEYNIFSEYRPLYSLNRTSDGAKQSAFFYSVSDFPDGQNLI